MPDVSFSGLVIVMAAAFLVPFVLGLFPRIRLPAVVLEIVAGIVIGPSLLGWVRPDPAILVLSIIGLAFLLFAAGLEVELDRLKGSLLRLPLLGIVLSLVLGLAVGFVLQSAGLVRSALLIGIVLMATSLGLVVPVLKDSGRTMSDFGQLVIAGSTVADFGAVIILTLFFSGESSGIGTKLLLLGIFALVLAVVGLSVAGLSRSMRLSTTIVRLADTTAQIRIRGSVLLLLGFVALATQFGLESILGAFLAGVLLATVDRHSAAHPNFRVKLEGMAYGFLVPIFFVTSGVQFDLDALFASTSGLLMVPVFLVALLIVRGVPAILYRSVLTARETLAAALLQATSLPFIVVATMIGRDLGLITGATAAALVAAGLLSVLIFPVAALTILRRTQMGETTMPAMDVKLSEGALESM